MKAAYMERTWRTLVAIVTAGVLVSGCVTEPGRPATSSVAYCTANPHDASCPGVMRRAKEHGVVATDDEIRRAQADKQELARARAPWHGRVLDAQVVSNTTPGSAGAGATLGAVGGQAAYLDNATLGNYSAMSQVGAGIAGALVGTMLDTRATTYTTVHYWIDRDGVPTEFVFPSANGTHVPIGSCVRVATGLVTVAPDASCG